MLERVLTNMGRHVISASDAKEGINLFHKARQEKTPVNLLITDLTLCGDMDGRELAGVLKKEDPNICALAISGYTQDPVIRDYKSYGFDAALCKPFRLERFKLILDSLPHFNTPQN